MCAPVARIAHLQPGTRRHRPITSSLARLRRRHVWLGPRNEQRETSFRGQSGPTWHHGLLTTHFQSQPTCRRAGRTRLTRPTDPAGAPDIEKDSDQIDG